MIQLQHRVCTTHMCAMLCVLCKCPPSQVLACPRQTYVACVPWVRFVEVGIDIGVGIKLAQWHCTTPHAIGRNICRSARVTMIKWCYPGTPTLTCTALHHPTLRCVRWTPTPTLTPQLMLFRALLSVSSYLSAPRLLYSIISLSIAVVRRVHCHERATTAICHTNKCQTKNLWVKIMKSRR